MKYLKIYEKFFKSGDLKNILGLFAYIDENFKPISYHDFVCDYPSNGKMIWQKDDIEIYICPFFWDFKNIIMQAVSDENSIDIVWSESVPEDITDYPEFFNWFFEEFCPHIIDIVEKIIKTKKLLTVIKIEENSKVNKFLENCKKTNRLCKEDIYGFVEIYDKIKDSFENIDGFEEAFKLGFFPKKKD